MGVKGPRDCEYKPGPELACMATARWLLVGPGEVQYRLCNVHRHLAAEFLELPSDDSWVWRDRQRLRSGPWPAHSGCLGLSSLGRRQTCQGAGSPSRVSCPLMGDQRPGIPQGLDRGETTRTSPSEGRGLGRSPGSSKGGSPLGVVEGPQTRLRGEDPATIRGWSPVGPGAVTGPGTPSERTGGAHDAA